MPVINRVSELHSDIIAWRRDIHAHPELLYDVHRTADFVAARLREFGVDEVATGIGRTGVVGRIKGRFPVNGQDVKAIGLRADMDALPIEEQSGASYRSTVSGKMHACGHDGHTAMLLGAARYLAETRNFAGEAIVIFQPAEEGGAGADAMIKDGLIDRFAIDQIYGMHNSPGMPIGTFGLRHGPAMAATDHLDITVDGVGGHAALPHKTVDPVLASAHLIVALQSVVSRTVDPLESAVVSICHVMAGEARNVIPHTVALRGTVRTLRPDMRTMVENRIRDIAAGIALQTGTTIKLHYQRGYPVLVNHDEQVDIATRVAREVAGASHVNTEMAAMMGAEDFAYMLEARPGAFIFIGNGDSAGLHHPAYDFNDDAILYGTSYWIRLVETQLAGM